MVEGYSYIGHQGLHAASLDQLLCFKGAGPGSTSNRPSRVRVLPRTLRNDHAPVEALLPRAFLPAHHVAEWLETPVTQLDSAAWDTAEWGAQVESALLERTSLPDWPSEPGHRLKIMGEIMWAAAPKKTTTPSSHLRAP